MKKYIVYADSDNSGTQKQVCRLKREYEAISFVNDVKNLAKYGCMTLEMDADQEGRFRWDGEAGSWERVEE